MKHCDWGLFTLHQGDCAEVLKAFPDACFDSVVCDPPYGLSFMGKGWDSGVPPAATWAEVLRVLKPGGHMVAFFGTRTYHRGVVAVEDAGFEIRDQIGWAFGSGFPKSHNGPWGGTALKPAWEPIVLARKPLIGTVGANHAAHGTGALNIDGCRVPTDETTRRQSTAEMGYHGGNLAAAYSTGSDAGRWPANLIHDGSDEVLAAFPLAADQLADASTAAPSEKTAGIYGARRLDSGSVARFFYVAKASKTDRDTGCEGLGASRVGSHVQRSDAHAERSGALPEARANTHPTVKPTDLMRYLCRLITPAGGVVLDPFCGSGSTGKAAMLGGFSFVGVDLSVEYLAIAERRIAHAAFGDVAFGVRA